MTLPKRQVGRYVVLHHTEVDEAHFDFMLELKPGAPLKSWRLPCWPIGSFYQEALALDDHRNAFLEYEGALSRGRGQVRRVETGSCTFECHPGVTFTIELESRQQLTLIRNVSDGRDSKARRRWRVCSFPVG
jgi:hypothetical protein